MLELLDEAWSRDIFCRCLPFILSTEISVGIVQRVLKYLLPMPQAPTASPSVIYLWKYRQNKSVGKVLTGKKNFSALPRRCLGFFSDRSSDENGNCWRSIFWQTYSVGDAVGKNVTDELCVLHRQNASVGKTV